MTIAVSELFDALIEAGVDAVAARAAAEHVLGREEAGAFAHASDIVALRGDVKAEMATLRGELRTEMAEMKTEIIRWNVGTMLTLTAAWVAIATALRVFIK